MAVTKKRKSSRCNLQFFHYSDLLEIRMFKKELKLELKIYSNKINNMKQNYSLLYYLNEYNCEKYNLQIYFPLKNNALCFAKTN